jgi:polyferredoxin
MGNYAFDVNWQLSFVFITLFLGAYFFLRYPKRKFHFLAPRFSFFKFKFLENLVHYRYFSFFIRLGPALIFIFLLLTGFLGRDRASLMAPFVWTLWWTSLVFFVAFAGKIFCAFCPWDFFANLFQFGIVYKNNNETKKSLLKWPKYLKNVIPATIFFVLITWLELGVEITNSSYWTAVLGLSIVLLAVTIPIFFEKRAFCRYLCPVGRISGAYSIFAPVEIRVKNASACLDCTTKDCVKGNEFSTPCPTGLVPYKLKENTYCTLCTECIRSCDKKNLTINIRSLGSDVDTIKKTNLDEAILYLIIFTLTYFHGVTMVEPWFDLIDRIRNSFNASYLTSFTILYSSYIICTLVTIFIINKLISYLSHKSVTLFDVAVSFIPITLAYHLGHNIMHVLGEFEFLIPVFNDPFGIGGNYLGLKQFVPNQGINHIDLLEIQLVLLLIGLYYSLKTLRIRLQKVLTHSTNAFAFTPSYVIMYSLFFMIMILSLWLTSQPMVYRGGML